MTRFKDSYDWISSLQFKFSGVDLFLMNVSPPTGTHAAKCVAACITFAAAFFRCTMIYARARLVVFFTFSGESRNGVRVGAGER